MQWRSAVHDCAYLTQEAMGHARPDDGGVPVATGGASWRSVQRPCHTASKAARVPLVFENSRPVFKDYCRRYRVKN